jgi:hypothetical protein
MSEFPVRAVRSRSTRSGVESPFFDGAPFRATCRLLRPQSSSSVLSSFFDQAPCRMTSLVRVPRRTAKDPYRQVPRFRRTREPEDSVFARSGTTATLNRHIDSRSPRSQIPWLSRSRRGPSEVFIGICSLLKHSAKTLARGRAFSTRSLEPQWISSPSPVRVRCDVSACGTRERAPPQSR